MALPIRNPTYLANNAKAITTKLFAHIIARLNRVGLRLGAGRVEGPPGSPFHKTGARRGWIFAGLSIQPSYACGAMTRMTAVGCITYEH